MMRRASQVQRLYRDGPCHPITVRPLCVAIGINHPEHPIGSMPLRSIMIPRTNVITSSQRSRALIGNQRKWLSWRAQNSLHSASPNWRPAAI